MRGHSHYPSGWTAQRLKYVATYNDETLPESTDDLKEINYVEISGVTLSGGIEETNRISFFQAPSRARRKVRSGDILISTVRTYLKAIAAVDEASDDLVASTGFCVVRPRDEVDSSYLGWVAKSEPFVSEVVARSVGVSYPAINASELATIEVPLPPLDVQRRIARFLDEKTARIDALIEKKRELLDRLAEKRQALITRAVTQGLDPDVPRKPSGIDWLGEIPEHWEVWKLAHAYPQIGSGTTPASSNGSYYNSEVGTPWITTSELRENRIDNTSVRVTAKALEDYSTLRVYDPGSVFIAMYGATIGRLGINNVAATCNQACCVFEESDHFDNSFLFYWLWHRRSDLISMAVGGGQPNLSQQDLREERVFCPPIKEQRAIAQQIDCAVREVGNIVECIEQSVSRLLEYRSALITAAVTGQIENLLDSNVVETSAKREVPNTFKRVVLAAYIADNLCDRSTFGRVMFQKALHLCEFHAGVTEIGGNYIRDAAGPFDPQMMQSVHSQLSQQKWFQIHKRTGGKGYSYRRGGKLDTYRKYFHKYFNDRKQAIDDLLTLLSQMNTEQAEIVSTAYAAWNDLLLDGRKATTDEIIHLILNEWADEKRRISIHRWHKALDWMRNIGLVPKGTGSHTRMKRA